VPIIPNTGTRRAVLRILYSFIILFFFYHAAEYMILFKNSSIGFIIIQLLFFIVAWNLGNWNNKTGLAFWGLPFTREIPGYILIGLPLGIILYAVPFLASLALGTERISTIPGITAGFIESLPFAFGVIFSSFSEDILTRGIVFRLFHKKVKNFWITVISATVYLLNHIYRLNDGTDKLLYIFLLGIVFIIPVLLTQNLWITGSMHWAGNTFFFITHSVIQTESIEGSFSPDFLFAIWIAICIPLVWFITRLFATRKILSMDNPVNQTSNPIKNEHA
jgi:membrane protease YdiL (CAAX protease family)